MKKERTQKEAENVVDNEVLNENTIVTEQEEDTTKELENLKNQLQESNDSYLRLMADFDNYRRKALKEKAEILKYGGETILTNLLPVIDNFERALKSFDSHEDNPMKEGIELIYNQFRSFLTQNGIKEIETNEKLFDTDYHEAVTLFPAQQPEDKGKIVDCIQKGYQFHDKVIRFAKVVVAD